MTDCIFYGGKGGVGKTTCAAATALGHAQTGAETLVVSTDPAHSLADSLGTPLGPEPAVVEVDTPGRLWAVEIDAEAQQERYERIAQALAADLRGAGISLSDEEVEQIFAGGAPAGSDELAALDLLVEYVDEGDWEVVIFDTAPTGHTLRLFDTPEVLGLVLETTRSLRGQVRRLGTAARSAIFGPMATMTGTSSDTDDLAALQARLQRATALLVDPTVTEFRVVLLPEQMAIAETERLVEDLRTAEIPLERLVVNQVFDEPTADCDRCQSRARRHRERVTTVCEQFPDLAVTTLPEFDGEVQGLEELQPVGQRLI